MTDTIDERKLSALPEWVPSGKYSVARSMGAGCYGDPPGFPSYYLRAVYLNGDTPRRDNAPVYVLDAVAGDIYHIALRVAEPHDRLAPRLQSLWRPLPLDHERVRLWIRDTYRHMAHCYCDDDRRVAGPDDNGVIVYPVPSYKLRSFHDDTRFSHAWRESEQAAIAAFNADVHARAAAVAIPDNHAAARRIRRFYPDHAPDRDLIADPPRDLEGNWWETEASRPSIEECAPRNGIGARDHSKEWCQWCGRNAGEA